MISTPGKNPRKQQAMSPQRRSSLPAPRRTPFKTNSTPTKPPNSATPSKGRNGSTEEGITVAVRMRPLNQNEGSHQRVWKVLPKYSSVTQTTRNGQPLPERVSGRTFFTFDKTFNETVSTTEVYDSVAKNIVSSVVSGLNGTIFAYGQTSSGKTYTMQGSGSIKDGSMGSGGIVHMAANDIFNNIRQAPDRIFLVRASFLEIYNEEVRDLLADNIQRGPTLQIREDPVRGVFVQSKEQCVTDFNELLGILFQGEKNRAFAKTDMNERSSRSHTIFRITIESRKKGIPDSATAENSDDEDAKENQMPSDDGAVLVSTLNLVDLAGSESVRHTGATGERQKEGGMINTSLLTLSRVIVALGTPNQTHINFRDSKLTRILQPSLSGNARMAIICCATPSELYLEETRSTLLFASRAKLVKTRAQVNEVLDDRSIIRRLQRELAEARRNGPGSAQSKRIKALELKASAAGGAARAAEDRLDRLKKSILNGGALFGGKSSVHPLGLRSLDNSYENAQSIAARKGKRRYSDSTFKTGRSTATPDRMTSKAIVPHTAQKVVEKAEASKALSPSDELRLLREAVASKNKLISELQDELEESKELVLAKEAEIATSNAAKIQLQGARNDAFQELQTVSTLQAETQAKVKEQECALGEARADLERSKTNENTLSALLEQSHSKRQSLEEEIRTKDRTSTEIQEALTSALSELENAKLERQVLEEELHVKGRTEAELASTISELKATRWEKESLEAELISKDKKYTEVEATLEQCQSEERCLLKELEETRSEKTSMEEKFHLEKAELQSSLQDLQSEHETLQQQESESQEQLVQLQSAHKANTLKLIKVEEQRNQLVAESIAHGLAKDSLCEKLEAYSSEAVCNSELISQLEAKLCGYKAKIEALVNQVKEQEKEIQTLQSEKLASETSLNDKLSSAVNAKESLEVEKSQMQLKLVSVEGTVTSLSAKVKALDSDLLASTKHISQLEGKLVQQTSECKVSEETTNSIRQELLTAQKVVVNLRSSLEERKSELSAVSEDLEGVLAAVCHEDASLVSFKSSHEGAVQRADQVATAIADIQLQHSECHRSTEETLATIQSLELQISSIEAYLSRSETHFTRVNEEFNVEKTALESRLIAAENEISALTLSLKRAKEAMTNELSTAARAQKEAKSVAETFQAKLKSFKNLIDDLTNSNVTLKSEREKAKAELNMQSVKLGELELLIDTSTASLQSSLEIVTNLKIEKEALEEELTTVLQENQQTSSLQIKTSQKLKEVESRNNMLQDKLNSVNALQEDLEASLREAVAEKTSLESELESTVTEMENMGVRIAELETISQDTKSKLTTAMERAETLETEKMELQTQGKSLAKELEESKSNKKALELSLLETGEQVSVLENDLSLAQESIDKLETKATAVCEELSEVCQSRDAALASIALLQEKHETYSGILLELSNSKSLIEGQVESDHMEIENLSSTINELHEALDQHCLMLDNQSQTIKSIKNEKEILEIEIASLQHEKASAVAARDGLANELKLLESQAQLLKGKLAETKENGDAQLSKLEEEVAGAQQESSEATAALEALRLNHSNTLESFKKVKAEKAAVVSELQNMTISFDELQAACESGANDLAATRKQLSQVGADKLTALESLKQLEAEKLSLEMQVEEGKFELSENSTAMEALKTAVEEGHSMLTTTTKKLDQLESERSDAMQSLEQLTLDKISLETELANSASSIEKMSTTIAELNVGREAGATFINETKEQLTQLQSEKVSLQQELQLYQQCHEEAQSKSGEHVEELKKEKAASAQAYFALDKANRDLATAATTNASLQQKQNELEARVNDLSCSKVALEAENGSATAQIQLLTSQNSELKLEIDALTAQHATLESELHSARSELTVAISANETLEINIEESKSNLIQLQEESNGLKLSRGDLDENIRILKSQLSVVQRERDDATSNVSRLQAELTSATDNVRTLTNQLGIVQQERDEAGTALQSHQEQQPKNFSAEKEALNATIQSLQTTIEHGRGQLSAATKKLQTLEETNIDLNSRLSAVSQDFQDAIGKKDTTRESLKKAQTKILSLETEILQLEKKQDDHSNALLQEARNTAFALEDELKEKEKELQSVQSKLNHCQDELNTLLEDSDLAPSTGEPNSHLVTRCKELEADYSNALQQIEEERAARERSEKKLGEEKQVLFQDANKEISKLKTEKEDLKKKLIESEAEAYAGRETNEQIRDNYTRAKKEVQQANTRIATLEEETQELTKKLKEQGKQSNAEITRLTSSVNTTKAELYASKQAVQDLEDQQRGNATAEENARHEARFSQERALELEKKNKALDKELQKVRANIENQAPSNQQKLFMENRALKKELAKKDEAINKMETSGSGSGDNKQLMVEIHGLKKELERKDGRIKKLESVRLTKDQCRNLKKLKQEHSEYKESLSKAHEEIRAQARENQELLSARDALEKENASLRQHRPVSGERTQDDLAMENQRLLFDNQALDKKLRKFATHTQMLEESKVQIRDILSTTFSEKIMDGDIPTHIATLCDENTSLQNKCDSLDKQLQSQRSKLSHIKELEGTVNLLKKEIKELQKGIKRAEEQQSTKAGLERNKVAFLEEENLKLMKDLQERANQLRQCKKDMNKLRLSSLSDSPPAIQYASSDGDVSKAPSFESHGSDLKQRTSSPSCIQQAPSAQSFDVSECTSKKRSVEMAGETTPKRSRFGVEGFLSSRKSKSNESKSQAPALSRHYAGSSKTSNGKETKTPMKENRVPPPPPGLGDPGRESPEKAVECSQQ